MRRAIEPEHEDPLRPLALVSRLYRKEQEKERHARRIADRKRRRS